MVVLRVELRHRLGTRHFRRSHATAVQDIGDPPPLGGLAARAASPFPDLEEAIAATLDLISDLFGLELAMVQRLDDDDLVITHLCDQIGLGVQPNWTPARPTRGCGV